MRENPFTNLFKERSDFVAAMTDKSILDYIRESNYLNEKREILPAIDLPSAWKGYRPDCYFEFDDNGFDGASPSHYYIMNDGYKFGIIEPYILSHLIITMQISLIKIKTPR